MKKFFAYLGFLLIIVFSLFYISKYDYILDGITKIYLKGHITAYLSDYQVFSNHTVYASSNPQPWPIHDSYNKANIPNELGDYHKEKKTVAFLVFKNDSIFLFGDTDYFSSYFTDRTAPYRNGLIVINKVIEYKELMDTLLELRTTLKDADRICIGINKFSIYSHVSDKDADEVYDDALVNSVREKFNQFNVVEIVKDPELRADKFNFASPSTQIYLERR